MDDDGDDENDMFHHYANYAMLDFLSRSALGMIMEIPFGVVDG